jgi:hypothetical protein
VVWWTTTPRPDQLADWRQQAAYKARTDPAYRQLAIDRVSYRGYNCANWEFADSDGGQAIHVLDHGFIVRPGALAYAIELYGPEAGWRDVHAGMWTGLLKSFTPAGRRGVPPDSPGGSPPGGSPPGGRESDQAAPGPGRYSVLPVIPAAVASFFAAAAGNDIVTGR